MVYETEKGDLIEANLPNDNKIIKNYDKEVTDMTDLKEDAAEASKMEAKYVKLGENYDNPDPEVMEAFRKHIDMDEAEKSKKIPDDGEEAGEMAAETPEAKKKKDFTDEFASFKKDMLGIVNSLKQENEKLKKDITEINAEKVAEKASLQEQLINDMSSTLLIPKDWINKTSEKYGEQKADFLQDLQDGVNYAFGTPTISEEKEDMTDTGILRMVEGL